MGYYLRNNTEHAVFATKGKPMVPETALISSWFQWPRRRHSEKPDEFFGLVEQISPGPYLELFARRRRPGWDAWGNEVDSDVLIGETQ
jgi:N6-adenosine-specific RNA methylase IME4